MNIAHVPFRIALFSDIHCGEPTFDAGLMRSTIDRINAMKPDVVVFAGDITAAGYEWEFEEGARWLSEFSAPVMSIPGNHDSRNVGYVHFQKVFGERFSRMRLSFDDLRAERLGATGVTIVGVDSSEPDLNEGHVGREHYPWIRDQFEWPDDLKVFAVHHHLVSIPGTGRERNIITDAGDLLGELSGLGINVILSGHKHVPFFWGLNGMLLCNSGTAATHRVRGLTPPSFTELQVDATFIKAYLHYADERRELSLIFGLQTSIMARDDFYLTEEFVASNRMFASSLEKIGG
jgi:3',5'-cyclic-AMP phosphodiesterase